MIEDLTGNWTVKQAGTTDVVAEGQAAGQWLPAEVPGCIHLDLMKAGKIPDPFYGFNDLDVQWVADARWLYRRTFDCSDALLKRNRVELVCMGLDTFAQVLLNGQEVGRADNMFVEWRWDVTGLLNEKENEILILFESPREVSRALVEEHGSLPARASFSPGRAYTRKAQYASGWDWGPDLNTSGIWRAIFLEGYDRGRVTDVCARVDWSNPEIPVVNAAVRIEALEACPVEIEAALVGPDSEHRVSAAAELTAGRNVVELAIPVEVPRLWWPAGSGPQDLYQLTVSGTLAGEQLPPAGLSIGLRQIELRRQKDEEGETFIICVNGEPIFCKGANWAPADSFIPRLTRDDYEDLLQKAAEADMNMLRLWGGGIYERAEFYDACDRLGIMVWQDFMFACAQYPDHLDWFCDSVRSEAEYNVRRLRNHPCVVLWCGNNENQMFHQAEGGFPGSKLYDEVLPAVCAELDPTRPYWPGSPFGGQDPNSPTEGDQHFWTPWFGWADPAVQGDNTGRFISEFGFQAPPTPDTIRKYIPAGGHDMQSRVMEHHNRCWLGTERLYRFLAGSFRVPGSFDAAVYLMQLSQAEAVKMGVEHWRSRKFRTAGALFWQYNDCWPATSWSCLDYEHRPKALYYYARRFFAPVLPVIDYRDGQFTVRVVNDRRTDFGGELICGFGHLNGDQDWVQRSAVSVPANGVAVGQVKSGDELDLAEPNRRYYWCRLIEEGEEIGKNSRMLLPYKHIQFELPEWELDVQKSGEREFLAEVGNASFAKGVWLRIEGVEAEFSDNFFDVFPEVPVRVTVKTPTDLDAEQVHRRLRIGSVAEAQ